MSLRSVGIRLLAAAVTTAVLLAVAVTWAVLTDLLSVVRALSGPDIRVDLRDVVVVVGTLLRYVFKWL